MLSSSRLLRTLHYIPVTLGTPLTLVADGTVINSAGFNEGVSTGNLDTMFQFRFVEADRLTPVAAELVLMLPSRQPMASSFSRSPELLFSESGWPDFPSGEPTP